jgi:DNA-binding NtrC family response regulator
VDVRVIAATNKNLQEEIEDGDFREDLYHRIGVILIDVPPLRERRGDIPLITEHMADRLARRNGIPPKTFSDDALKALQRYEWRGNVRELHNVLERILILTDGDTVDADDVQRCMGPQTSSSGPTYDLIHTYDAFSDARDQFEKLFIEHKLDEHDWNVSQTAETIGIQRSHLYNKLNKYGIERDE